MFMRNVTFIFLLTSCVSVFSGELGDLQKNSPALGKPASDALVESWSLSIFPDGTGLPEGEGSVEDGEKVFKTQCAICHGPAGIGGTAEELSGGEQGLTGEYPDKTIGTYWPYATTLFDFIKRAMPLMAPGSLSDNQVYAVSAYLLYVNKILPKEAVLSQDSLPTVEMPNRDGMDWIYPKRNMDTETISID